MDRKYSIEEIEHAVINAATRALKDLLDTGIEQKKEVSPSMLMAMTMYSSVLTSLVMDELKNEKN